LAIDINIDFCLVIKGCRSREFVNI
jgi:hypothetical protein